MRKRAYSICTRPRYKLKRNITLHRMLKVPIINSDFMSHTFQNVVIQNCTYCKSYFSYSFFGSVIHSQLYCLIFICFNFMKFYFCFCVLQKGVKVSQYYISVLLAITMHDTYMIFEKGFDSSTLHV